MCLRILIAGGNSANPPPIARMLSQLGHEVVSTFGREAMSPVQEPPFDLILMDSHIPVAEAMCATAGVRARGDAIGVHVPIIAMTGHTIATERKQCIANGVDYYVAQPRNAAELTSILAAVSDPESVQQNIRPANWDRRLALQHAGGDESVLHDVMDVYTEEKIGLLAKINFALKSKHAEVLEWAALKLAEKLTYLGAAELSGMAREIAFFGRKKKFAKTGRLAVTFELHLSELDSAMVRLQP